MTIEPIDPRDKGTPGMIEPVEVAGPEEMVTIEVDPLMGVAAALLALVGAVTPIEARAMVGMPPMTGLALRKMKILARFVKASGQLFPPLWAEFWP